MNRLQAFAADLLEREGALVEPIEPEGLEVLAPPQLQQAIGIPDLCRLGFGASLPPGARRVGIEADWLARFAGVIGERGKWMRRVLRPSNPPLAGVERLLEHELALPNATFRLRCAGPVWTRYLILDFRFTALSDEKREGLLKLGINLATGAVIDDALERLMSRLDTQAEEESLPEGVDLPPPWDRQRVLDLLSRTLRPLLEREIAPFAASLQRRLARDQVRLHDYHNRLFQDAARRLATLPDGEDRRQRERQRAEAIQREYRVRLDDLGRKYALRVTAEWVQTLELVMPVQRLELLIRRRKGERVVHTDWNPLARRLEPLPCAFAHAADRVRLVCDDALHIVGAEGLAACASCGRPYCRVCHPRACPKCRRSETTLIVALGQAGLPLRGSPLAWRGFSAGGDNEAGIPGPGRDGLSDGGASRKGGPSGHGL